MIILTVDSRTTLHPLNRIPDQFRRYLRDRLSFPNPKFIENEKRGFSNWDTEETISCLSRNGDFLVIPRGFTRQLVFMLRKAKIPFRVDDRRRVHPEVDFQFKGELRDFQQEATAAMLQRDFGTLSAPTGSGKTVMALYLIAARRQPALVVVHTKELLHQWIERIETFLGIPAGEVGVVGSGKRIIGEKITVALVQSLYKCASEISPHIGHLVVDECHRTPSRTFTEAITSFDCRYALGLSATPWRKDKLNRRIYWFVGDVVHKIDQAGLIDQGHILEAEVIIRETSFQPTVDPSEQYSRMLSELTQDPARNRLIVGDVMKESRNGSGIILVLSDRKSHCETLLSMLRERGLRPALLTGDCPAKERRSVVEDLNGGRVKVLVATGQLIGEGFDCRALSTLFLATPIKFSGRVLQYLGRVLRPAQGKKKARVFDYVDPVGVLLNAAKGRAHVFGNVEGLSTKKRGKAA